MPFLIIVVLLFASCKTIRNNRYDTPRETTAFINAFKDHVFFKCFAESYPAVSRDSIFKILSKFELYNPNEDFRDYVFAHKNLIDSLGISIPKNLAPFWHRDGEENKGKNVYIASCLHYYASSQLDSIAKAAYKKYRMAEKKAGF